MGYTHYWRRHPDAGKSGRASYPEAIECVLHLLNDSRVKALIVNDSDASNISFNGVNALAHKDFIIPTELTHIPDFSFCKTACKPYDVVVVAVLATIADFAPHSLLVTSDGVPKEWADGCELASEIFGCHIPVPPDVHP